MELFRLLGTIAIDNAEAKKALKETSGEAEKTESKLGKAFSAVGKGAAAAGKAIATGLAVGATAMAGLTAKALSASGELEQNLGGAEAVFKSLGGSIKEMSTTIITGYDEATGKAITATTNLETVSKEAYKNMGLSQSDYLATANKMGALFQGAGFETQEALDLSSQAMQRAADVASIMGIDTESAMEAVAGAAKGNFTMMDNLGVAMNDTAIGAYALEKGIDKTTAEMSQQEKIGLAMEMFLEKTAYAAGNYAKENETLAGSLSTAKSAFTNFLSGSGDVDSLVSSFSNLANVVINSLDEIVPRLTTGLVDIVNQVAPMLPELIQSLLPIIVEGAVALINGLISALPGIIQALMDALPGLLAGIGEIISSIITAIVDATPILIEGLVNAFGQIVAMLPELITQITSALPTLIPQLVDGIVEMIVILCNNFMDIIQPIIDALPDIIISIVEALTSNLPAIIEGLITLVMSIVEATPEIIQGLVDAIPTIISLLIEALLLNLPAIIGGLIQVVWGIVKALPQIFASLIEGILNIFVGIWDGIKNVFNVSGVSEWFSDVFGKAWEAIQNAWDSVVEFFKGIWNGITQAFSSAASWFGKIFKSAWSGVKTAWNGAKNFFGETWSGIKNAFGSVKSWFSSKFSEAWQAVKDVFSGVGEFFSGIWDTISDTFTDLGTTIGDAIGGAVKAGINGVISGIETVINAGIGLINGAIDAADAIIPGNAFGNIDKVSLPRLAKGGVLEKGQIGLLEGSGAEAVVPLENNEKWVRKTAQDLKKQLEAEGAVVPNGTGGVKIDTNTFETAGKTVVQSLWDGVDSASSWLGKKFTGLGVKVLGMIENSFVNTGKDTGYGLITRYVPTGKDFEKANKELFEQARKMKNGTFGQVMARGVAKSFLPSATDVEEIAGELLDVAQQKFDAWNAAQVPFRLVDEVAYWDVLRGEIKTGTEAWTEATQKYYEAKSELNTQILDAETELVNSLGEIYDNIDEKTEDILGSFSLFSEYTAGNSKPKDWFEMNDAIDSQIESLELYTEEMDRLKSKIGGTALYDELEGMGLKGLSQIQYINQMTDHSLQQYLEKYEKREELAKTLATKELAEESLDATQQAFKTFEGTLTDLGVTAPIKVRDMRDQMYQAFQLINTDVATLGGNTKTMAEQVTEAFDTIMNKFGAVKDALGISSMDFEGNIEFKSAESGVEWYAKAMHKPMILNQPTIFGYDSATGKFLGGGEAGSEVVAGSQTLMNMIQTAVSQQNTTITVWLQKVFDILSEYFPQMLEAFEAPIDFNPNSMASALAVPMNRELGKISSRKDRGR